MPSRPGSAPWFVRVPRRTRTVVRLAALATIAVFAILVSGASTWPGYLALGATVPTAALILLGERRPDDTHRDLVDRGLSTRPMQRIGAWSYSLYLWHWPPLAILAARWDGLTPLEGTVIVLASIVPAVVSFRLIEDPFRRWEGARSSARLSLSFGANLTLAGIVAGLVLVLATPAASPVTLDLADGQGPLGARSLDGPVPDDAELVRSLDDVVAYVPASTEATDDVPITYAEGCQVDEGEVEPVVCEYGDRAGETHVALVGDSKAGQWAPALIDIAERSGWRLTHLTKSACEVSAAMPLRDGAADPECLAWGERVVDLLTEDPPDLVLVSQGGGEAFSEDPEVSGEELMVRGMVTAYERIEAAGSEVVVLLDNVHPGEEVYECVAENPEDLAACAFERDEDSVSRVAQLEAAERGGFRTIDMLDRICPTATCLPIVGDVLVYRQGSHLTATYVRTAGPELERRIADVLG